MESKKSVSLSHYLIVATGIVLCLAPSAMPTGCAGIFYPSIMGYLEISKATLAIYQTILGLSIAVTLPFIGRLMERFDLRIMLTIGASCSGITMIAMSFFNAIWQWYIAGFFLGVGVAICLYLAVPTLIGRWFKERVGFFIGLCMAFTGVGGVVFNALGGVLIASGPDGWRLGYLVFGIICLAITLPFTIFAVRSFPSDKGLLPFEKGNATEKKVPTSLAPTGVSASKAMRTPVFFALAFFAGFVTLASVYFQFIPTYCASFSDVAPMIAAAGATAASAVALGQALGKILLGSVNDKSPRIGLAIGIVAGIIGFLLLWFAPTQIVLLYIGAFLFGMFYALATVQVPLVTRLTFGMREYSQIYSRISMVAALAVALGATLWGVLIDVIGFYWIHAILIGMAVVAALLGMYVFKAGSKLEHTEE